MAQRYDIAATARDGTITNASLAPELLLASPSRSGPIIVDIAPRLAPRTGHSSEAELVGQPLEQVFHEIMPGLPVVVGEVLRSGMPVHDYRLTYTDHDGVQRTAVRRQGRAGAPGQSYRLVGLRLEELPQRASSAEEAKKPRSWHRALGQAPAFVRILHKIELYGPTDAPVLITGETGTGKEIVARALHECSQRRQKPFVAGELRCPLRGTPGVRTLRA